MAFAKNYAEIYDLLYKNKDYSTEAMGIHQLIQRYAPGAKTILDIGCGTGNHAIELAKLGYSVTGIDISSDMLNLAKKKSSSIAFLHKDIRTLKSTKQFNVAISLFHVMSYLPTEKDLSTVFLKISNCLTKNGLFIFDSWDGRKVIANPPEKRIKIFENSVYKLSCTATPNQNMEKQEIKIHYSLHITNKLTRASRKTQESHFLHYWFNYQIQDKLTALFDIQKQQNALPGIRSQPNSWNTCIVAQKKTSSSSNA